MKIIRKQITEPYEIDVKRLYLPFLIEGDCPTCQKTISKDLEMFPLSYPALGETFDFYLYCSQCDVDFDFGLMLDIQLTTISKK